VEKTREGGQTEELRNADKHRGAHAVKRRREVAWLM
jgi:hypothetical protein